MDKFYFVNNEIVKASEAKLHVSDLSIVRGFGIFDFFRTSSGKPLFMRDHLDRFYRSARQFHLPLPHQPAYLENKVKALIELNGFDESGIKLVLTGGYSENGFVPGNPNLLIMVDQLHLPNVICYEEGVRLISYRFIRSFPEVKSTNYLTAVMLIEKCKQAGALDVLYHDGEIISELTRSNIFLVKDKVLITPSEDILKGITRSKVLQLAQKEFAIEERKVRLEEVWQADEIFITSSMKRVMPVVAIDDMLIGSGRPGEVTKKLMHFFLTFEKATIQ